MIRSDADELLRLLEQFIGGADRSRRLVDEIEGIVIECFQDESWFEDVSTSLAQYVPGGGEHYFDEKALAAELKPVVKVLEDFLSKTPSTHGH